MNPKSYEMPKHFEIMENTSGIYIYFLFYFNILSFFKKGGGGGEGSNKIVISTNALLK